jgi:hypothetical protein
MIRPLAVIDFNCIPIAIPIPAESLKGIGPSG